MSHEFAAISRWSVSETRHGEPPDRRLAPGTACRRPFHWPFLTCLPLWTLLVVVLGQADGEDWPQWRGPRRDGVSAERGLIESWDSEGPKLLWKATGLGGGYSSVVVAGGRIFTMGRSQGRNQIVAVEEHGGSLLWSVDAGSGGDPNCTPTSDLEYVYGVSLDGELTCVEIRTGRPVWKKSFPRDFGGQMMSGWGYSESPLIDEERLICTPGGQDALVVALNKRTGETVWKTPVARELGSSGQDGAGYSSIVVSTGGGTKQYIQLAGRGVISVDAESGGILWNYNRIANGTANIPTPIVHGDYVFCSSGYGGGGSALLKIQRTGDQVTAEEVYYRKASELQNHHGGMILVGDYLYMGHGHNRGFPVCVELLTGKVAWGPVRGPGSGSAAVAYADGRLYFRYQDGVMALIDATPDGLHVRGQFKLATLHGQSWPHPVIANGRMLIRDQQDLLCYDLRRSQR